MTRIKFYLKLTRLKILKIISLIVIIAIFSTSTVTAFEPVLPVDQKDTTSSLDSQDVSTTSSSTTGTGKPPRFGPNVQVNDPQSGFPNGLFGRSETSIASTPDGRHLVAGWNDADGFCDPIFGLVCAIPSPGGLSGYAYSNDGGLSWTDGGAPPIIDDVFSRGDPWLDSDGKTFFYANLAVDANSGASLGVSVHRGEFKKKGQFSWNDVSTFDSPNNDINPGFDFYDKEAIVVAKDGSGDAYVSLTNFEETCGLPTWGWGTIELWRTHDGGDSWQGPTIVSPDQTINSDPADPNCGSDGHLQQSSVPAIGPNGEVYVVWQLGPTFGNYVGGTSTDAKIVVATSLDGGVTFGDPVVVAEINSMRQNSPVAFNRNRINDHPRIAVATSGPERGRVYVTYYSAVDPVASADPTVQSLTSSQVYLAFSDDKGQTWTAGGDIVTAPSSTTVKRFWPVPIVEPNGNLDVIYLESVEDPDNPETSDTPCSASIGGGLFRTGPAHSLMNTYWAQSTDGGETFSTLKKVSTVTTDWCQVRSNIRPNMGDYIGAAGGANYVFAVWADGRNGVPDTFVAKIHGAGKSN